MKKNLLLFMVVGYSMTLQAQKAPVFETSAKDEITVNRYLSGSNYLDYDRQLTTKALTPAPKGYEPYYMSHYGRHGSRWLIWEGEYTLPMNTLKDARMAGKLTPVGEETLKKLEAFFPTMAQNFPEIFKHKDVKIDARSTTVFRCILSMIAECEELAAANPTAQIHNDVSESLQYYLNQPWEGIVKQMGKGTGDQEEKAYKQKYTHPERLIKVLFNDEAWVRDNVAAGDFMRRLFDVAANMQDYGPSMVSGQKMPFSQRNLLKNIIETADTITQTQATLRFGHEVCVMPLACLLELDNCGMAVENLDELDKYWRNYRIFPMGCNIQLVFYKPQKGQGDILVKALLNERETYMPAQTDNWPYYKWQDLRQYYLDKLAKFDAENAKTN